jgi:hypothetical protein
MLKELRSLIYYASINIRRVKDLREAQRTPFKLLEEI